MQFNEKKKKKKKTVGDWREDVHSIRFLGKSKLNYMKP